MPNPVQTPESLSFIIPHDRAVPPPHPDAVRYWFDEQLLREFETIMHAQPAGLVSHMRLPDEKSFGAEFEDDVSFPTHRILLLLLPMDPFAVFTSPNKNDIARELHRMMREGVPVHWQFSITLASGRVTAAPQVEVTAAHQGRNMEPIYLPEKERYALCKCANVPPELDLGTLSRPIRSYKPLELPEDINRQFGTGGPPRRYGYVEDVVRARRRFAHLLMTEPGA